MRSAAGAAYDRGVWVTAYVDASFSRAHGGGWAVWLRCALGRLVRRGPCPPYVRDSTAAELAAIFAAVHLAATRWPGRVRGVLVRGDCQGALALADPQAALTRNAGLRTLQQKLRATTAQHAITLECRWVRGHQAPSGGTSAFLNDACDRLARRARKARAAPRPRTEPGR